MKSPWTMDRFERMAFSKDGTKQLVTQWGADAFAVAEWIRLIEHNELMSRIKKGLLCGYSLPTQTTLKD